MATLQGAIAELVDVIAAVDGIIHAPDEPSEQIATWPAAMTYATDGTAINEPPDVAKDLHNIQIVVIMPLVDYRQVMKTLLPLYEPIRNDLIAHRNGRTSAHYATFGTIAYTLGPIEWTQGQEMFGYVFTIQNLKIINGVT
jgi:hypothetical protein